jgi:23S rRNA (guanosine2251-2'-O)-methyltransferase
MPSQRIVYGKHSVMDLLEGDGELKLEKLILFKGMHPTEQARIREVAEGRKVRVELQPESWFHQNCGAEARHQGVAALAPAYRYADLTDLLKACGPQALIIVLDQITDPRNLGAILRSAEALGAAGAVIPRDRACEVTPVVEKTSSGAASRLPVAQVANLSNALDDAKKQGFWCYGLSLETEDLLEMEKFSNKVCLVVGSEGKGLRPLVAKHCDKLLKIGMRGKTQSLNVSVAAALSLHKVAQDIFG